MGEVASRGERLWRDIAPWGGALAAGLVSQLPDGVGVPWPQPVALLLLVASARRMQRWRFALLLGVVFTVARYGPVAIRVDAPSLPFAAVLGLALYLSACGAGFASLVFALRRATPWMQALIVGAGACSLEWLDAQLPMWGTAMSLASQWVDAPDPVRGLVATAGSHGVAFAVAGCCAWVVASWEHTRRGGTKPRAARLAAPLLAAASLLVWSWSRPPLARASMRVAVAIGENDGASSAARDALLRSASEAHAELLVLPEAWEHSALEDASPALAAWRTAAARARLTVVVPYLASKAPRSRVVVIGPDGTLLGRYAKRHLVPLVEAAPAGPSRTLLFEVHGVRVGVVICQDDNYSDVVSELAGRGAALVVAPTFEGPLRTGPMHFANARLRTIEHPIALARAASRGTSAVVAPGGAVVASLEDDRRGARLLVADVPLDLAARR